MTQTETLKPQRMKLEILEVKERQPIGDRGAVKLEFKAKVDDKELKFFTFSTRLFEAIEASKGQILEADIVTSTREGTGNFEGTTFTDRKVTQIYKDGQPVAVGGGRQYGKSAEEIELSRRSYALSYAKDMAIAKLIEVKDILTTAEVYYRWLSEGTISIALKTLEAKAELRKPTVKSTAQKTDTPAPDLEQAERDSEELFPKGGSKGSSLSADNTVILTPPKEEVAIPTKIPKTQEQLFNYVAKHAKHKDTKFTKSYLINKFKIPEKRINEDIPSVYYEVKQLNDWPEYDGE